MCITSPLLSCAEGSAPEAKPEAESAVAMQASTTLGIERTIPTRFIRLQATDGSSPAVTDDAIRESVEAANNIFARAAVQFDFAGVTRVSVPKTFATDRDATLSRSAVLPLTNALSIPTTWCGDCSKTSNDWRGAIMAEFFGLDELVVWVVDWGGGASGGPDGGASVRVSASMLGRNCLDKLAHEIGHNLGLGHSFEQISCKWWDQVYFAAPAGFNKPFLSRQQCDDYMANVADASEYLRPIDVRDGGTEWCMFWDTTYMPAGAYKQQKAPGADPVNTGAALASNRRFTSKQDCVSFFTVSEDTPATGYKQYWDYHKAAGNVASRTENSTTGIVTLKLPCRGCAVPQSFITGDTFVRGITRKVGAAHKPAYNVMTYYGALPDNDAWFISDSQAETVLQSVRINAESAASSGQRTRMGTKVSTDPLRPVDLDGDKRRDIVTWNSPNSSCTSNSCPRGKFRVLLSSKNYSTTSPNVLERAFGIDGDSVVLDDYDRDGKTDLGVYRAGPLREMTGGSTSSTSAHWLYCSSRLNYDCSRPVVKRVGNVGDIPIPGLHFASSNSTGEVAVFRPSVGQWWWGTICQPGTSGVTYCSGEVSGPVVLGSEDSILMPDLWDGDALTDIAVFDRTTATVRILRSELGYASQVTRAIGAAYIAGPSGSVAARAGVNILPQYRPYGTQKLRRRTIGLYDYGTGNWVSKWDWLSTSATVQTCATDQLTLVDTPIGGLDLNNDVVSDRVTFAPTDKHSLLFNVAGQSACGATTMTVSNLSTGYDLSRMVSAVADMSGDGKADVLVIDPVSSGISIMTASSSGFTLFKEIAFGDEEAQFY